MVNWFIIHICTHTDVIEKNNSSSLSNEVYNIFVHTFSIYYSLIIHVHVFQINQVNHSWTTYKYAVEKMFYVQS